MDVTKRLLARATKNRSRSLRTPDYRKILEGDPTMQNPSEQVKMLSEAYAHSDKTSAADCVRMLKERDDIATLAFQSVAVSAVQLLRRVRVCEEKAVDEALSLAQREKLHQMVVSLDETIAAVEELLTDQGRRMLAMGAHQGDAATVTGSWEQALDDAQETNRRGADWLQSAVCGQPKESAAARLSQIVTGLLQQHSSTCEMEAASYSD